MCESVAGIMGFHVDGLAAQEINVPARLLVPIPDGPSWAQAACGPVTFATVQHMLFDNARLEPGETILVHAAGSGVGSTAILMAKRLGCTVIATVGSDDKIEKAKALGADHVINYRTERFEGVVRRLTKKRGVDVVFEHIGPDTWNGSLFSLARGGRLVTCGSTSGISAETNLFHLFQQQLRIIGSFGASFRNIRDGYAKMASGEVLPLIDSEIALQDLGAGLKRMQERQVFGKIVVHIP
jgi:alcohol dehydrogenase